MLDRSEAAQISQVVDIDVPVVDLVIPRAQEIASAPRVEGIATKSRVVASWASKPASTASRILCWVSAFIGQLRASGDQLCAQASRFQPFGYSTK